MMLMPMPPNESDIALIRVQTLLTAVTLAMGALELAGSETRIGRE
jgi:hypothetical protein